MRPGDGLRDLARQIEAVAREHPEWSRAHEIVLNCTGYLCAVAKGSDVDHDTPPSVVTRLPEWPFNKGDRR